jgi:hypothetical protein
MWAATETIPVKLMDGEVYVGLLVAHTSVEQAPPERTCG